MFSKWFWGAKNSYLKGKKNPITYFLTVFRNIWISLGIWEKERTKYHQWLWTRGFEAGKIITAVEYFHLTSDPPRQCSEVRSPLSRNEFSFVHLSNQRRLLWRFINCWTKLPKPQKRENRLSEKIQKVHPELRKGNTSSGSNAYKYKLFSQLSMMLAYTRC